MKKTGKCHLFAGKVFCLECQHPMRKKNSSRHAYLACSGNLNDYDTCFNKTAIRYDVLESMILEEIQKKIHAYFDIAEWNRLMEQRKETFWQQKISLLEKQEEKLQQEFNKNQVYLKSLYEDRMNGMITDEQFHSLLTQYQTIDTQTNEELKRVAKEIEDYKNKEKNDQKSFSVPLFQELDQVIVDTFISKIYIGKVDPIKNTRVIEIEWNLK